MNYFEAKLYNQKYVPGGVFDKWEEDTKEEKLVAINRAKKEEEKCKSKMLKLRTTASRAIAALESDSNSGNSVYEPG